MLLVLWEIKCVQPYNSDIPMLMHSALTSTVNVQTITVISAAGIRALIGPCVTSLTVFQPGKVFPTLRSINHCCTTAATSAIAATSNVSVYSAITNTATVFLLLIQQAYYHCY